jgi:hypothetical protein
MVDILMVVDDSGSMNDHQANLAKNIDLFTKAIEANEILDYHIGVVTTSMGGYGSSNCCGKLVGFPSFVTKHTPSGAKALANNLRVGTGGDVRETVFAPSIEALTEPLVSGVNAGFYRKDAYLGLVFITDAEDQSDYLPLQALSILQSLKPRSDMVISYGVISPVKDSSCGRDQVSEPAVKIEEFVNLSGGFTFSLCAPDFGERLAGIADDLMERVSRWLPLSTPPVVSSIEVKYGAQIIPMDLETGWWYDSQRVALVLARGLVLDTDQVDAQMSVRFVPADL